MKLRVMRLGPGAAQKPAAPEDGDEWSTVGRKGAKTTTRGDECLAVRPCDHRCVTLLLPPCRISCNRDAFQCCNQACTDDAVLRKHQSQAMCSH